MDWKTTLQGLFPKPDAATNAANDSKAQAKSEEITLDNYTQFINPESIKFFPVYSYEPALTLYARIMTRHPPTWSPFFKSADREVYHACEQISRSANGKSIFPLNEDILTAFWLTPVFTMKCVILGQDPYPGILKSGLPKAMGVCFAASRESKEIPDSLVTVYKELETTVENWTHPGHADIRCWGKQGVLLVNTALTVEAGNAGSHVAFWQPFTAKLMEYLNANTINCVFMLWGSKAQKAAATISRNRHHKLDAYHPSSRNSHDPRFQFAGCNHFNLANIYLVENGIHPINWQVY